MSVLGFRSKSLKSLANCLLYWPLVALIACSGLSGGGGNPTAPGADGNPFSGGVGAVGADGSSGGGSSQAQPTAQTTQDGVIMPVPGALLIRVQAAPPPLTHGTDAALSEALLASEGETPPTNPPPSNQGGKAGVLTNIPTGGILSVDIGPAPYLMVERFSNDIRVALPDFYHFADWEILPYSASFSDSEGHFGMIVRTGNYRNGRGELACTENITVWACHLIDGKYYASQKLTLNCPYGLWDHPYGSNAGDVSTILFLREQPMQACPNQPPEPVNENSMDI